MNDEKFPEYCTTFNACQGYLLVLILATVKTAVAAVNTTVN